MWALSRRSHRTSGGCPASIGLGAVGRGPDRLSRATTRTPLPIVPAKRCDSAGRRLWRVTLRGQMVMGKRVLAVDDSASSRAMVSFTLRRAGYEVVEAADGIDGLEKATEQTVDLVLTDQNMPRMDGLTLIRSLRQMPTYRKAPILVLTTDPDDEIKIQGREAGATGWMVKPFDPQRLLSLVKKVIG